MAHQGIYSDDGKLLRSFKHLVPEELRKSLVAAQDHFQTPNHKSHAERAVVLNKASTLLHAHRDDFAKLETLEMGNRINEAPSEVKLSGDILVYSAQRADSFLAPLKLNPELGKAPMESSPLGLLFCVEPWNFSYCPLVRVADALCTNEEARGQRLASQVDTGMMFIKNIDWTDAGLPFGGIKHSGYGRELGSTGIQEFVNKKLVRSGAIAAPI